MSQKRILELAYIGALEVWYEDLERSRKFPEDPYQKEREQKSNAELEEISTMLLKIQHAE